MANTTGKKFGGRQAGTPNKTSREMRQLIQGFLERQLENVDEVFKKLNPKDKMNILLNMFPYVLSKQMLMEVDIPEEPDANFDLSLLSEEELAQFETLFDKARIHGGQGE